jgi:hypothetical protein
VVEATASLDVATGAAQRLCNQQAERAQFHGGDPANRPVQVEGVGDDPYRAYWVVSLRRLYATRTGRFLIVDYAPPGGASQRALGGAIRLAKLVFARTGDLRPPPGLVPQASC